MTEKKEDDNKKNNETKKRPRKPDNPQQNKTDFPPKKRMIIHFIEPTMNINGNKEQNVNKVDGKNKDNDDKRKDKKTENPKKSSSEQIPPYKDDDLDDFIKNMLSHIKYTNNNIWGEPLYGNSTKNDNDDDETIDLDDEDEEEEKIPLKTINDKLENIDDLINLGKKYDPNEKVRYNFNMKQLSLLVEPLQELQTMIGMSSIKEMVFNHILFHLQGLDKVNHEMKHATFEGNPGCGKTEVAKIMAKIYLKMGFLKNDKFIIAKRSDLIGKYLGHTAVQTQNIIDKAEGGVLFIDEAYSLGNAEQRDSFSKECIDTLTQNLDEKKKSFVCFIAGYPEKLKSDFFAYNPGLERRFPYRYRIDEYNGIDLMKIYKKKVIEHGWEFDNDDVLNEDFFEKNRHFFKFNGGDIETLFNMTKIAHAKRVFGKTIDEQKKITIGDIEGGMTLFKLNDEVSKRNPDYGNEHWKTLYN